MLKQCLAPMAAVISVWKILKYENLRHQRQQTQSDDNSSQSQ